VSGTKETPSTDLNEFAAAVAHEIRTPLTAVAGEIEVALRRDRSPEEYREVLRRIAAGVSELVAISGDLALLGDPQRPAGDPPAPARLDTILRLVRSRYHGDGDSRIAIADGDAVRVVGDEKRIARAVALVVEHAIRHRRGDARVSVRAVTTSGRGVRIVVDAEPPGFWPNAWTSLTVETAPAAGPLRLRTARRILDECGGAVQVARTSGADVVHIHLREAA
jgi:signal transduction histidine kinase